MTSIKYKHNRPNVLGHYVLPNYSMRGAFVDGRWHGKREDSWNCCWNHFIHQLSKRCPTIIRSIVYRLDPFKINDWIASSGASLPPYCMFLGWNESNLDHTTPCLVFWSTVDLFLTLTILYFYFILVGVVVSRNRLPLHLGCYCGRWCCCLCCFYCPYGTGCYLTMSAYPLFSNRC